MRALSSLVALSLACSAAPSAPAPRPASVPAASAPASAPTPPRRGKPGVVTLAAVGDILPHLPVKEAATKNNLAGPDGKSQNHNGYDTLFARAKPFLEDADLTFGNLEAPVAIAHEVEVRSLLFNGNPDLVEALKWSGFDLVSLANNHAFDQGSLGFAETLDNLDALQLPFVGAGRNFTDAWSKRVLPTNGIDMCFMGFSRWNNRPKLQPSTTSAPQLAMAPYEEGEEAGIARALAAVKRNKPGCDFLIVSIHWGSEYKITPAGEDVALAKQLLDAGADAILGHHTHVPQPIKRYTTKDGRDTFIAYSLGNFVSHQDKPFPQKDKPERVAHTRDSLILRAEIVADGEGAKLASVGFYPALTDRRAAPNEELPNPDLYRGVVLDAEIKAAEDALKDPAQDAQRAAWQTRLSFLRERRAEIVATVGESLVLPLPE